MDLGKLLVTYKSHRPVENVSFNQDESKILISNRIMYDLNTRRFNEIHKDSSYAKFSPDGSKLAFTVSDMGDNIFISDVTSGGNKIQMYNEDMDRHLVYCKSLDWSPDSSMILACVKTINKERKKVFKIYVWDVNTGDLKFKIDNIVNACWSPDGTKIACFLRNKINIYSISTPPEIVLILNNGRRVSDISNYDIADDSEWSSIVDMEWSPDGSKIATNISDRASNDIRIWDAFTGNLLKKIKGVGSDYYFMSWSPNGSKIAFISSKNNIVVWSTITYNISFTINCYNYVKLTCINWRNESKIIAGFKNGEIRELDTPTISVMNASLVSRKNRTAFLPEDVEGNIQSFLAPRGTKKRKGGKNKTHSKKRKLHK